MQIPWWRIGRRAFWVEEENIQLHVFSGRPTSALSCNSIAQISHIYHIVKRSKCWGVEEVNGEKKTYVLFVIS